MSCGGSVPFWGSSGCGGGGEISIPISSGCGGSSRNLYVSRNGCGAVKFTVNTGGCGGRRDAYDSEIITAINNLRK